MITNPSININRKNNNRVSTPPFKLKGGDTHVRVHPRQLLILLTQVVQIGLSLPGVPLKEPRTHVRMIEPRKDCICLKVLATQAIIAFYVLTGIALKAVVSTEAVCKDYLYAARRVADNVRTKCPWLDVASRLHPVT